MFISFAFAQTNKITVEIDTTKEMIVDKIDYNQKSEDALYKPAYAALYKKIHYKKPKKITPAGFKFYFICNEAVYKELKKDEKLGVKQDDFKASRQSCDGNYAVIETRILDSDTTDVKLFYEAGKISYPTWKYYTFEQFVTRLNNLTILPKFVECVETTKVRGRL